MRRNKELEAGLLLAQRFGDGGLPLPALLAPAKRTLLSRWARRHLPGLAPDQAALVAELRSRLAAEPPLAGAALLPVLKPQSLQTQQQGINPVQPLLAPVKRTPLSRWARRYLPGPITDQATLIGELRSRLGRRAATCRCGGLPKSEALMSYNCRNLNTKRQSRPCWSWRSSSARCCRATSPD